MNDLLKIRRGDVFFCKQSIQNNSSVENKSRPVVVVSNNTGNSTSTTCVVCPITTRDSAVIPSQVRYFNATSTSQVIMCEQIKTVAINDLQNYLGYLSEDIMKKVDNALRIQLDLDQPVPEATTSIEDALKFIESKFEALLKSKLEQKDNLSDKQVGDVAMKIAQMVDDLTTPKKAENAIETPSTVTPKDPVVSHEKKVETPIITPPKSNPIPPKHKPMSQIDKFNARYGRAEQPSTPPSNIPTTKSTKGKRFNSDDERREFWRDCDKLPLNDVCKKWNMTPKDVYNHKYLIRKKLGM